MRAAILAVVGLVGCAAEPAAPIRVEMRLGSYDDCAFAAPSHCGDWSDGASKIGDDLKTQPPGKFVIRVRQEDGTPLTGANVELDPMAVCGIAREPSCADGYCFGEVVQPDMGLCMLHVRAVSGTVVNHACWLLGTYAMQPDVDQLQAYIDQNQCGGTFGW